MEIEGHGIIWIQRNAAVEWEWEGGKGVWACKWDYLHTASVHHKLEGCADLFLRCVHLHLWVGTEKPRFFMAH